VIVGLDIGTQSLKAVVCDDRLAVLGSGAVGYAPEYPAPGRAEQDPGLWERALGPAIAAALDAAGVAPGAVAALGVTGQLDGCIAVGADGRALAPALIWMDRRATAEIAGIPAETVRQRAGAVLDATHMAAKIRWLARHGPGAARYHQPVSYLVLRLTGEHRLDHGLASTTMLYGLAERDWDDALLALFDLDRAVLPPLAEAFAPAGPLSPAGAALSGLPAGIPVAVGTGDDFANPLGAGLVAPGCVAMAVGTAEVVGALDPRPLIDAAALVETHAYAGPLYFIENPGWLAGGAVRWFVAAHRLDGPAAMDGLAAEVPAGAEGVLFLPALSGAMAPRWVASARAAYYGLSAAHGAGHMARAVLEGCAFAARDVVERLREMGVAVAGAVMLGGGARSRLWARIRADILDLPVTVPHHIDTAPIGAAMLAAVAGRVLPSLEEAAALVGGGGRTLTPDGGARGLYDDAYGRYRCLFDSLKPMYENKE